MLKTRRLVTKEIKRMGEIIKFLKKNLVFIMKISDNREKNNKIIFIFMINFNIIYIIFDFIFYKGIKNLFNLFKINN